MMLRSETVLAFMPEVLSPVTAEQSLLQVITTLISTVLKTHQSVRRLKSRQATVITSMKSPTRLSKKATDRTAYDLSADYENLIMYTCYPFDALGLTPQRYFVYAKLVSGTPIDKEAN